MSHTKRVGISLIWPENRVHEKGLCPVCMLNLGFEETHKGENRSHKAGIQFKKKEGCRDIGEEDQQQVISNTYI